MPTRRYKAVVHDRETLTRFLDEHIADIIAPSDPNTMPIWMKRLGVGSEFEHTRIDPWPARVREINKDNDENPNDL